MVGGLGSTGWAQDYENFKDSKTRHFDTINNPEEWEQFKGWFGNTKKYDEILTHFSNQSGVPKEVIDKKDRERIMADQIGNNVDYDMVGAWKRDIVEEVSPHDNRVHWTDTAKDGTFLKTPNHPTVWKEFFMREHTADPDSIGLHTYDKAKQYKGLK